MDDHDNTVCNYVMADSLDMDSYYYNFDLTGCRAVDELLSSVIIAGKASHHTRDWTDTDCFYCHPFSAVMLIQEMANRAASQMKAMEKELEYLRYFHVVVQDYLGPADSEIIGEINNDYAEDVPEGY